MPDSKNKKGGKTQKTKGRRSRQKSGDEESADEAVHEKAYKKAGGKRGRSSKHAETAVSEQADDDTLDVTGIDLEVTRKTLYKAEDAYFNGVMPHKRAKASTVGAARDAGFLFGVDPVLRNSSSELSESFSVLVQHESSKRPAPLVLLPERRFVALRDELLLRENGAAARAPAGFRLSPRDDEPFDLAFPDVPPQPHSLPLCKEDGHRFLSACEAFGVGVSAFPQAPSTASTCFTALPEVGAPQTKSVPRGHFQVYYLNTTAAACEELRRKAMLRPKKHAPAFLQAFIRLTLRNNASSKTEDAQSQQNQERLLQQLPEQHDAPQEGNTDASLEQNNSAGAVQEVDPTDKTTPATETSEQQQQLPSLSQSTSDQPQKVETSTTTSLQKAEHLEDQTAPQESANVNTPYYPPTTGAADNAATDAHTQVMTFAQRYSLAKLCHTVPLLYAAPDKFVSSSLFVRAPEHNKLPEPDAEEVTKRGKEIVAYLLKQQGSSAFAKPVDPEALGIPTYFDVVKHPMDLGTVMRKLDERAYATPEAFAADVSLVFDNAVLFNPEGHAVHDAAIAMRRLFETRLRLSGLMQGSFDPTSVLRELDRELKTMKRELANLKRTRDDVRYQVSAKVVAPPKRPHRPSGASWSRDAHSHRPQPKPKPAPKPAAPAQMSAEEKNRRLRQLHQQITLLPQEKLQDVLQIVQETVLIANDSEFELDLEKLPEQTLERLEAFVRGAVNVEPEEPHENEDVKGGSPVILGDAIEGGELESKPFALDQGAWNADLTALDMGEMQQHEHEHVHEHEQTDGAPAVWGEKHDGDAGEEFLKDAGDTEKRSSGAEDTFQKLADEQRRQQQRAKEREAISQREREKAEEEKRAQEEQAARLIEEKRRAEEEERSRLKEEEERRIDGLKAGTYQTDEQTADLLSEYMG